MLAAAVVGGMWSLFLRQLAVAARRSRRFVPLLHVVFIQMAAPIPQAVGRLFRVGPDVAKRLAVTTLGQGVLGFVCLYLHGNVVEAAEFEYIPGFFSPWQGNKEQSKGNWFGTIRGPTSR
jgi:hypothetical protein